MYLAGFGPLNTKHANLLHAYYVCSGVASHSRRAAYQISYSCWAWVSFDLP